MILLRRSILLETLLGMQCFGNSELIYFLQKFYYRPSSSATGGLPKGISANLAGDTLIVKEKEVVILKDNMKISSFPLDFVGSAIAIAKESSNVAVGSQVGHNTSNQRPNSQKDRTEKYISTNLTVKL
jgi:hypothetical protein